MDAEYGLSRSSLDMHLDPSPGSAVVHALKPQERLVIRSRSGEMLEVESTRWQPPIRGFVSAASVVQSGQPASVFPLVDVAAGIRVPTVPISLPLIAFMGWLQTDAEAPWLPPSYLAAIKSGQRPPVGAAIRSLIEAQRPQWDAWVAEVMADGRLDSATVDEWIVLQQGGRDMWSIRAERIFTDPSQHASTLGWVVPDDVLRWTGRVRNNEKEPKYRLWYEVELAKGDRQMRGWYKADLLDEFFAPTPQTDFAIQQNRATVFDLARAFLRLPTDPEIEAARKLGRAGVQYIDIRGALGSGMLHHNLCGPFCAAALVGLDVIPLLEKWLGFYPRARDILTQDHGTSTPDLQSMLDMYGVRHEYYRAVGGTSPITPNYVRRKLDMGMSGIVFTGVTPYGVVSSRSPIRHWVVVEDILRVGSGGWVRLYNPFTNREEIYLFEEVFDLPARDSVGLWVEPRQPGASELAEIKIAMPQPSPQPIPQPTEAVPAVRETVTVST